MKVSFFLKEPKAKRQTAIFARVNFKYKETGQDGKTKYRPSKLYVGESINPVFWNQKTEKARETSNFPEYPEFNDRLKKIRSEITALYLDLLNQGKFVTPELIKRAWDEHKNPENRHHDFYRFAEKFIQDVAGKRAYGSIKNYRNSLRHIKEFAQSKHIPLEFSNIDLDFHLSMVEYLTKTKKFAPNTIWRINRTLKTLLNEANERGFPVNPAYKSKKFSVSPEETDTVYLTTKELDNIFQYDLLSNKRLDKVRDVFLVGCFTGLRFGDLSGIKPANMVNGNLRVKTQKTGEIVEIPLSPLVKTIVDKYNGAIPKPISNQKFNEYIKDVCKLAEINQKVNIHQTRAGLQVSQHVHKWELITSHTARRSFCTNAYLAGIPVPSIMKISGHRTERAFMAYIKVTGQENAAVLSQHPFFNKSPLIVAK